MKICMGIQIIKIQIGTIKISYVELLAQINGLNYIIKDNQES